MGKNIRHNKKRNTAFLLEVLSREITKSIVSENKSRRETIRKIILENIKDTKCLSKELSIMSTVAETSGVSRNVAEKILLEAKIQYASIDKKQVYKEQTNLINIINKILGKDVYNSFVPNYKSLATLSQIFNSDINVRDRVILEEKFLDDMTKEKKITNVEHVDNIVYKKFVERYNKKYSSLLEEQRTLLSKYVSSFADNGVEFKLYLNNEVGRLREGMKKVVKSGTVSSDKYMLESARKVALELDSYKDKQINNTMLENIMNVQKLLKETL